MSLTDPYPGSMKPTATKLVNLPLTKSESYPNQPDIWQLKSLINSLIIDSATYKANPGMDSFTKKELWPLLWLNADGNSIST